MSEWLWDYSNVMDLSWYILEYRVYYIVDIFKYAAVDTLTEKIVMFHDTPEDLEDTLHLKCYDNARQIGE